MSITPVTIIIVIAAACVFSIGAIMVRVLWRSRKKSTSNSKRRRSPGAVKPLKTTPLPRPAVPLRTATTSQPPLKPTMRDIYPQPRLRSVKTSPITPPRARLFSTSFTRLFVVIVLGLLVITGVSLGLISIARSSQLTHTTRQDWYNTAWPYRVSVLVHHRFVAEEVIDFPLLVTITDPQHPLFAHSSDGKDLVFTTDNGRTKLPHEIEAYDAAAHQLIAWVKVPKLSPTTDTSFYLYYGNPTAPDQGQATEVWSKDYSGVYHFQTEQAAAPVIDSTKASDHTLYRLTQDQAATVPGKIGGALAFNGPRDVVDLDNVSSKPPLTISAWVKPQTQAGTIIAKRDDRTTQWQLFSDTQGHLYVKEDNTGRWPGHQSKGTHQTSLLLNNWQYVAVTIDSEGTPTFYNDGIAEAGSQPRGTFVARTSNASIGARWSSYPATDYRFVGEIDTVRIATVVRSAEWLKTEHANQAYPETFLTLATTPETPELVSDHVTRYTPFLREQLSLLWRPRYAN
jgi:hypothetical protein